MARLQIDMPEEPLYEHRLTVRVADINYGRHLGHDSLISLLHEARVQMFRHLGAEEWDCEGLAMVVVELAVRYRAEAFLGDPLVISIAVGGCDRSRCELLYRVRHETSGAVVADARTGIVFMDLASRAIGPVPGLLAQRAAGSSSREAGSGGS